MYKTEDESVMHNFSGCSKLAQRENRMRQVNMGKAILWDLCSYKRTKGFEHSKRWYEHNPERYLENDNWKIL